MKMGSELRERKSRIMSKKRREKQIYIYIIYKYLYFKKPICCVRRREFYTKENKEALGNVIVVKMWVGNVRNAQENELILP